MAGPPPDVGAKSAMAAQRKSGRRKFLATLGGAAAALSDFDLCSRRRRRSRARVK